MSAELDLLRLLAPDLAAEPDARVEDFITEAARRLNGPAFGALFPQATIYFAAHLLAYSPDGGTGGVAVGAGGASGALSSKKTGDEALTFGSASSLTSGVTVTMADADLMTTHYGRQFLAIRGTRSVVAPTVITIV